MLAGLCRADGHFGMEMVRAGNEDRIDLLVVQQPSLVRVAAAAMFSGELLQCVGISSRGGDEANAASLRDCPRMGCAEIAGADNSYSNHGPAF
ncbi:hypothetical protein [Mesorhizobium sp. M0898]|uniref:hypothetical protein n=1 Tax=Mesorhizobium sp. M0898 TaxID=2957020 RepID=UPI003336FDF0